MAETTNSDAQGDNPEGGEGAAGGKASRGGMLSGLARVVTGAVSSVAGRFGRQSSQTRSDAPAERAGDVPEPATVSESDEVDAAGADSPVLEAPVTEAPDVETTTDAAPPEEAGDLSRLTVAQLRERARLEGRTGYSRLTKAQLIEMLSS